MLSGGISGVEIRKLADKTGCSVDNSVPQCSIRTPGVCL